MKIQFGKPNIDNKEIEEVVKVLNGPQLVHGPIAKQFENDFSEKFKVKYAVSLSSCTSALHLSLHVSDIKNNDEVILPAMTHVATAHAIEHASAKPVFVDVEEETGNINSELIKENVNELTKAIIIVHYLGLPCDMEEILAIKESNDLLLIEDCALSLGAKYDDKYTGSFGDAGCFSFYPVKHITTAEGGMLTTNSDDLSEKILRNKAFGYDKNVNVRSIPGIYDVVSLGYNYRMSEIHAAIGLAQLKKIDGFIFKRTENYNYMLGLLKDINEIHLFKPKNDKYLSSYYCMNITFKKGESIKRNDVVSYLNDQGIGVSVHYPKAVPQFRYYKEKYNFKDGEYPVAEWIAENTISLPVAPHIGFEEIDQIIKHLKEAIYRNN